MANIQTDSHQSYDDFSGAEMNPTKWAFLDMPTPDGTSWRCQEPKAKTTLVDSTCTITVKRFERSHDVVQLMDNPKHLLLSTASFAIPAKGARRFEVDMAATGIKADRHDYRDGFAGVNVLDMASGVVFNIATSGGHVYAIHEQLPISPTVTPFIHMIENPMAGVHPQPGVSMRYEIELDRAQKLARWRVNGKEIFRAHGVTIPSSVRMGFGLFTLHPIAEGRSSSLKGQGLTASWSRFTVSPLPEARGGKRATSASPGRAKNAAAPARARKKG